MHCNPIASQLCSAALTETAAQTQQSFVAASLPDTLTRASASSIEDQKTIKHQPDPGRLICSASLHHPLHFPAPQPPGSSPVSRD